MHLLIPAKPMIRPIYTKFLEIYESVFFFMFVHQLLLKIEQFVYACWTFFFCLTIPFDDCNSAN